MSKKQTDTLSQLKKEEEKNKKPKKTEEEEQAEEEEEEGNTNVVKEQTIQKGDKAKNLKDLLGGGENKPNPKPKKNDKDGKPAGKGKKKDEEDIAKPQFISSKDGDKQFSELNREGDVSIHY